MILKNHAYDDYDRIARLNRIMLACINRRMALLAEALHLGYPYFTDSEEYETAAVEITDDGRIRYTWNRKFFDEATDLAVLYVALHESLHVVLHHPQRSKDRNHLIWNMAVDIVTNETLDELFPNNNLGDLQSICDDPVLRKRLTNSYKGLNCYNLSADRIYDKLLKKIKKEQANALKKMMGQDKGGLKPDNIPGDSEGEDGKGGGEPTLDSHKGWEKKISPQTQHALAELSEEIKESIQEDEDIANGKKASSGRKAGQGSNHLTIEIKEVNPPAVVPWQKLLRNRLASVHRPNEAENWARPHRKMYELYPDMLLPGNSDAETKTSSIFFTFDTSGSMNDEIIAELVAIGKTLPEENYEVYYSWFDTSVYEARDLAKPQGRGGTEFNCVETVLTGRSKMYGPDHSSYNKALSTKEITRYPDVVVMFTDGENFSKPTFQHPERWIFILTKDGTDSYIKHLPCTIWKL